MERFKEGEKFVIAPRLEVITGCMTSGKTEELVGRLRRMKDSGLPIKIQAFQPFDGEYQEGEIVSSGGVKWPATLLNKNRPESILYRIQEETNVVAIDDAQFFGPGIVETCETMVRNQGLRVIVAGLDTDYEGRPFGSMPDLMAVAEDTIKLKAICTECGEEAVRTQKVSQEGNGSAPKIIYEARCIKHHYPESGKEKLTGVALRFFISGSGSKENILAEQIFTKLGHTFISSYSDAFRRDPEFGESSINSELLKDCDGAIFFVDGNKDGIDLYRYFYSRKKPAITVFTHDIDIKNWGSSVKVFSKVVVCKDPIQLENSIRTLGQIAEYKKLIDAEGNSR